MKIHDKRKFSISLMDSAFDQFRKNYLGYNNQHIEHLRQTEYRRLDKSNHIYLDYTGGGLYGETQLQQHMAMLREGVFGNPHSGNPTSMAMTSLDEHARDYIFEFFNVPHDEYIVIFTANASGALKLVGESYPFTVDSNYLLTFDNHNSVNGIREFAKAKGAAVKYVPVVPPDLRLSEDQLLNYLKEASPDHANLFAYTAQSNFSGVQHSLDWIDIAHQHGWDVLIDAAAFAPTNRFDISKYKPDFVSLSFYKIFGYPTGVGALLARREAVQKLHRPWFAGGTIEFASVQANSHYLADGEAAFEDGTINYLNLPAIEIGLKFINSIGIETIHDHVMALTNWLLDSMTALVHSNGKPLFRIYGPLDMENRGGTIACNFYDADEKIFDFRFIEDAANEYNISLRTGCFCNPGAGELALGISGQELSATFANNDRMTYEQFVEAMTLREQSQAAGAVRISVGLATNFSDVYRFMAFAQSFVDQKVMDNTDPLDCKP